jgi:WD40 repeat protein
VALSPDGALLATSGLNRPVQLWDLKSGLEVRRLAPDSAWVGVAAFTPDGRSLAVTRRLGGDDELQLLPVSGDGPARPIGRLPEGGWMMGFALSADGKTAAAAAGLSGSITLWDVAQAKELRRLDAKGFRWSLSFSPDGRFLASASEVDKVVRIWDTADGKEAPPLEHDAVAVVFGPDGKRIAAAKPPSIRLWTWPERKELPAVAGGGPALAFSPDGGRVVADHGDVLRVVEVGGARQVSLLRFGSRASSLAFGPGGALLAAGSAGGRVSVWDVATGRKLLELNLPPIVK